MDEFFDLEIGSIVEDNYRILDYLGSGWEGEVYKVEEIDTGILRALKLFYQRVDEDKTAHILYARKLHRLRTCPIIIQYHHKGSLEIADRKVDYLISDFVGGQVLSEFLASTAKKKLSLFEALHIFYVLASGVEHIHSLKEYHGDLHTDNIIVQRKGLGFDVKLIDILHLGRSTKERMQEDVYDLVEILYEMIGGQKHYKYASQIAKNIIMGRKKTLISKKFKNAGHIKSHILNLEWA